MGGITEHLFHFWAFEGRIFAQLIRLCFTDCVYFFASKPFPHSISSRTSLSIFLNQNWKRLFQVPFSIPFRDKKIKRISKQRSKIAVRHREWRATWAFPRDNKSDKEIVVALRKDYLLSGSPEFFNTIACSTVFSWFWINFIITERLKRYMFTRISHERKGFSLKMRVWQNHKKKPLKMRNLFIVIWCLIATVAPTLADNGSIFFPGVGTVRRISTIISHPFFNTLGYPFVA